MISLPEKYNINSPIHLGWLALYICICTNMKPDEAMEAMGIKYKHKYPTKALKANKSEGRDKIE